jgi:hypothetical protein
MRENAARPRDCRKKSERNQFDAEIRASNAIALRFKNSFARSSICQPLPKSDSNPTYSKSEK